MGTRERPADRGRRRARDAFRQLGRDHRLARRSAGLSLRAAGSASGTSHQRLWRFEHGQLDRVSVSDLGTWCSVVGLDLVVRAYPAGDPIRDRAHAALLGRLRSVTHPSLRWRTEEPLPIAGDLRAWDAVIRGPDWEAHVEAETRVDDGQAIDRKLTLKQRDGGAKVVILLVADTRNNRGVLAALRQSLRGLLPYDTRAILAALREGREPPGSGVVVL